MMVHPSSFRRSPVFYSSVQKQNLKDRYRLTGINATVVKYALVWDVRLFPGKKWKKKKAPKGKGYQLLIKISAMAAACACKSVNSKQ
jgi:hypothetical protein